MNYHKRICEILKESEMNQNKIVELFYQISIDRPSAICKAYDRLKNAPEKSWLDLAKEARDKNYPERKVNAIKELRTKASLGLKEAKDLIDRVW